MELPIAIHRDETSGTWSVCTAYAVLAYRVDEQSAREAVERAFPGFPLIDFSPTDPVEFKTNWASAISFQVNALQETLHEFQGEAGDELERLSNEVESLQEQSNTLAREQELFRLRRELANEEAKALRNNQQLLDHLHNSRTSEFVKNQSAKAILGNPTPRIIQLRKQIKELEE